MAPCVIEMSRMTWKNNRAPLLYPFKLHHFIAIGEFRFELQSGNAQIWWFFASCDPEILRMTLKNNRVPHLYPFKLYASFHSHWWVYIWVTIRKRSNWVKFDDFLPPVTLKFYGWPWKTRGHLFYTHSSLMHHTIPIGGFRFEFQSGNAQIGSNFTFFAFCALEILGMTLKNNRAPLLSNIKLCASFHHHIWIETGVTVRK